MELHDLQQGSSEWHAHRANHFNASDAPAMLGVSPYKSRSDLLREYAAGIRPDVDPVTQKRFDRGHRFEALARPLAEKIIGNKLYPVTGSEGRYSASFDGLTMCETLGFEHKTMNSELLRILGSGELLPELYTAQMEHQLMVSGAEKILFVATSWDDDDELIEMEHRWYESDPDLRQRIIAGWEQFEKDLENYRPEPKAVEVIGRAPESLPAIHIEVTGMVTASNLSEIKAHALEVFENIKTDLQTDQDFADAAKTAKWCGYIEDRLEAAKRHALSQTASIDELFRTIDAIKSEARDKRLHLEKLVKVEKDNRKSDLIGKSRADYLDHLAALDDRLGGAWMPRDIPPFAEAIKGLKTLDSMRDKLGVALSNAKIEANSIADRIEKNRKSVQDWTLFPDFGQVCAKEPEDFAAILALRVNESKEADEKRLEAERERIRQEEAAKLQADQAIKSASSPQETPAQPIQQESIQDAVIEHQDEIAAFLASRSWGKGEESKARAILIEFVKFQAGRNMRSAA